MARCVGSGAGSPGPLEPEVVIRLSNELHKCVKKDQLVKAKFILKGLKIEEKKRIVSRTIDGNAPLFVAAQQGQLQFVNYLIEECGSDLEQRGVYEVPEDRSKHQVTSLWCAAVANKLEVVKTLIKHNADIGAPSDTQSTPVRSACFMTNIDVVRYLVANGADIHKPNINGGTCLINSVQSVELCKILISKGAKVNAQDNSGNLALHYAIREGRMDTVRLLVRHGSSLFLRNDFGDDALQTASLRGYSEILEYLITRMRPSLERQIEAYELMATIFVDDTHDLQKAIQTWRHAMELRYRDPNNIIYKPKPVAPNPAYMNVIEAQDMKELEEIAANPDSVYMQALLIRERILGADHKDTIFGLMYRGAVYADTHRYQRCVDLWKYGFQLRHEKREPLNHECFFTLQALCKLFWEIYEEYNRGFTNEKVSFDDVLQVLEMASKETLEASKVVDVRPVHIHHQEAFHAMLQLLLHLASLLCCLPKDDEQELEFKKRIHSIVSMGYRESSGSSLLHMAVDKRTSSIADEFYSTFPSVETAKILLECGAEVNVKDDQNNTPLHLCAQAMPDMPQDPLRHQMKDLISCLLKCGAHVDVSNKDGIMPYHNLSSVWLELRMLDHITLKCICAQAIKRYSIPYQGEVPKSLIPFIQIHE